MVAVVSHSLEIGSQMLGLVDSGCCQEHFHEGEAALCLQGLQPCQITLSALRTSLGHTQIALAVTHLQHRSSDPLAPTIPFPPPALRPLQSTCAPAMRRIAGPY